jgi:hypothetical protein
MRKARDGGATAPARWALEQAVDSAALACPRSLVSIDPRVTDDAASGRLILERRSEIGRAALLERHMRAAARKVGAFVEDRHGKVLWIPDPPRAGAA